MQANFSEDKAGKITLDQMSDVSNKNDTSAKRGEKRPHDDDEDIAVALPDELKKMFKPLICELCDVSVSSPLIALTHYKGKSHLKRVNNYMQSKYNITNAIKKKKDQFEPLKCEVCNIELNSKIVYEQHLAGRQHIKNMKRNKTVIPCSKVEEDPTGRFGIGKAFQDETNQPTATVASVSKLYCEICQVSTHTELEMTIHKNGKKHKKKIAAKGVRSNVSKVSEDYYSEKDVWEATSERNDSTN